MYKLKRKIKNVLKWIKDECKDWRTIVIFIVISTIIYFPTWGGYLLYWIFKWKWCLSMATISMVFWLGPFTPFFPLCIATTFFVKGMLDLKKKKEV